MIIDNIELDETNQEFHHAADFVHQTDRLVYLTGKAGTGKTTFLKYIRQTTEKNMVVLAPTGVAAVNAGGETIHSFFHIKPSVYIPDDPRLRTRIPEGDRNQENIYNSFKYNNNKREILKWLDLLIIDEISMVRCDSLDVIDKILKVYRKSKKPFGGVQVILIGDTFQLPPVADQEQWDILKRFYESPFFFSSHVIKFTKPIYLELKKIYRQNEKDFIDLLNRVRINQITKNDIDTINSKYNPGFISSDTENYITLATHNRLVNTTNLTKLAEIPGELKEFEASIKGNYPENLMPTDQILKLKENAQIMLLKNGPNYYNGKIGKIKKIKDNNIITSHSDTVSILIGLNTWENVKYTWNKERGKIEEEIIGTFTQYPIKLAWAITVHKSQGLTFDKVIADLGKAFAPGQVYVALSRCTSFNGLVLKSRVYPHAIKTSPEVIQYAKNETPATLIIDELEKGKADSFYKHLRNALKKDDYSGAYALFVQAIKQRNDIETELFKRYFEVYGTRLSSYKKKFEILHSVCHKLTIKNVELANANHILSETNEETESKIESQNKSVKLLLDKTFQLESEAEVLQETFKKLSSELGNTKKIKMEQDSTIEELHEIIIKTENTVKHKDSNNRLLTRELDQKKEQNLLLKITIEEKQGDITNLRKAIKVNLAEILRLNNLKWYHKLLGRK